MLQAISSAASSSPEDVVRTGELHLTPSGVNSNSVLIDTNVISYIDYLYRIINYRIIPEIVLEERNMQTIEMIWVV